MTALRGGITTALGSMRRRASGTSTPVCHFQWRHATGSRAAFRRAADCPSRCSRASVLSRQVTIAPNSLATAAICVRPVATGCILHRLGRASGPAGISTVTGTSSTQQGRGACSISTGFRRLSERGGRFQGLGSGLGRSLPQAVRRPGRSLAIPFRGAMAAIIPGRSDGKRPGSASAGGGSAACGSFSLVSIAGNIRSLRSFRDRCDPSVATAVPEASSASASAPASAQASVGHDLLEPSDV